MCDKVSDKVYHGVRKSVTGSHLWCEHCEWPPLLLQLFEDGCPVILHHVLEGFKGMAIALVQRPSKLLVQLLWTHKVKSILQ
jgi:hypothetical protein